MVCVVFLKSLREESTRVAWVERGGVRVRRYCVCRARCDGAPARLAPGGGAPPLVARTGGGAGPCGRLGATYLAFLASFFPFAGGGIPPAAEGAVLSEAATAESPARAPSFPCVQLPRANGCGRPPDQSWPWERPVAPREREQWYGEARVASSWLPLRAARAHASQHADVSAKARGGGGPRLRHMMCSPGPTAVAAQGGAGGKEATLGHDAARTSERRGRG